MASLSTDSFLQTDQGPLALKATLVWHDPPASPRSRRALVNDLDLVLLAEDGATILPTLVGGAQGVDTLNNVEQVRREREMRERERRGERTFLTRFGLSQCTCFMSLSLCLCL